MEVKAFQGKIVAFADAWDRKRGVAAEEQVTFTHLVEEIGELAREYVSKETRKDRYSEAELENAIGDALMQLVRLADIRGLDIETVVGKIIEDETPMLQGEK